MSKIKVLLIDDERLAREEVKHALKAYPEFEVVGEAAHADEARMLITALNPELLFLDINMPEEDGFELLESLENVPDVIFTTAYDQYAVRAFEVNALDYLVKPMRAERFEKAIEKIRDKRAASNSGNNHLSPEQQLFIRDGNKCYFLRMSDVYLIESMDNYARLYFEDKKTYIKRSLNQLEEKLDGSVFFRINRNQIINRVFIKQIDTMPKGRLKISLKTGQALDVSTRQSAHFRSWRGL